MQAHWGWAVSKRMYLSLLMRQTPDWLRASMAEPTPYMSKTHLLLHAVALRRMRGLTPNAVLCGTF